MNTVDLSKLAAYSGDYSDSLISELYTALQLEKEGILVIDEVKSTLNLHKLLIADGMKPYTGVFVSKTDLSYEPRVLTVEKAQRDFELEPSAYLPTFMAQKRGRGENSNNMNIPFAQFMWEAYMKKIGHEVNSSTVYFGVGKTGFANYAAGTAYNIGDKIKYTQNGELRYFEAIAATAAGQNPDTNPEKWKWAGAKALATGFGKIIADEITAGNTAAVATGALDGTNSYAKQMQLFRSLPETVKMGQSGQVYLYQSMNDYEYLMDSYETNVSKNFETIDGVTYLAKTEKRCAIKPVSWLSGSRRIIATVQDNLVAGTDQLSDMNQIKSIPQHYTIQTSTTFVIGFQIQDLAVLKVNDQV